MGVSRKAINVLVVQEVIEHYRFALYRHLQEIPNINFYGFYHFQRHRIDPAINTVPGRNLDMKLVSFQFGYWRQVLSRRYDVVIAAFSVRILSNLLLLVLCKLRGIKFIWWGIGFGKYKSLYRLRAVLARLADAVILYEDSAAQKMIQLGVNRDKIFVMHNTVHVDNPSVNLDHKTRTNFLFIGSLHKRKQIDVFVKVFAQISDLIPDEVGVDIVGDGEQREILETLVQNLQLETRIRFHGQITDEEALRPFFNNALVVVSPGQAGLSVLESFAHGVGFVTKTTAISGGEIENIKDGFTGYLYDGNDEELKEILYMIAKKPQKAVDIGVNAHQHYVTSRRMDQMAEAFQKAVMHTLQRKQ